MLSRNKINHKESQLLFKIFPSWRPYSYHLCKSSHPPGVWLRLGKRTDKKAWLETSDTSGNNPRYQFHMGLQLSNINHTDQYQWFQMIFLTLRTQRLTTMTWTTVISQIITKCHPGASLLDHLQGRELISKIYLAFRIQEEYTRNKAGCPCPQRAYNLVRCQN